MAEADDDARREAHELAILSGAFLKLAQRLSDRARALDDVLNGKSGPPAAGDSEPPPLAEDDALAPAVLMATNLAALGHSRDEIRTYLTDAFELEDPELVLDRALDAN
jgi:hypothetical protein